jgi:2-polyprenyl-3-methyl-5-hydroxy-6-metoxy-1,4-benzoquinol methylase
MKSWFTLDELNKTKRFESYLHLYRYNFASKNLEGKILDIGCGAGYNLKNKNWYGIDVDKNAVKLAKITGKAKYGSIFKIPFKNETFDGICCLEVVEHVKDKKKAIKEIFRVLKYNGKVIVSTLNPRLIKIAKSLGWKDKVHNFQDDFIFEKDLKSLFGSYGFKLISSHHFFWFPPILKPLFCLHNFLGEIFKPICYDYLLVFKKIEKSI